LLLGGCDTVNALLVRGRSGRNRTVVKLLIKRGATPNGLYAAGWWEDMEMLDYSFARERRLTLFWELRLFLACWCWRRFEAAKFLARKGADVNYQDEKGKTALHHGVEKEFDPALLKWLVKRGASPDIEDRDGVTARVKASRKKR